MHQTGRARRTTTSTRSPLERRGESKPSRCCRRCSRIVSNWGDETHLSGTFDVDLRWSNDLTPTDDLRSIFAALQEQLRKFFPRLSTDLADAALDREKREGRNAVIDIWCDYPRTAQDIVALILRFCYSSGSTEFSTKRGSV